MERVTLFADILLPIPVAGTFTYRVPFDLNDQILIGQRVAIQFGRRRVVAGLIKNIHENVPTGHLPKYILSILDAEPLVLPVQFTFWQWISEYYMCTEGEVMAAALPSVFKLSSESKVMLHPGFVPDREALGTAEYHITEALLQKNKLTIDELTDIVGIAKILPILKSMIEKNLILMEEELQDAYKPKLEKFVSLTDWAVDEDNLRQVMDELGKRAHKQLELLMAFIGLAGFPLTSSKRISQPELLTKAGVSASILKTLVEKNILKVKEVEVSRLEKVIDAPEEMVSLSPHQQEAYDTILKKMKERRVVLLHGVTSGGKTEVYIRLMERALAEGKQVLYLLPEIALTTQIIQRLQKYFGDRVGIYHSRFGKNEKAEVWLGLNSNKPGYQPGIVLGPRSAVFLPFDNLGLIIVDEEHDASYKQFDPGPRYNARDAAIYLASLHEAKVILGSATPAIETYYNAAIGKFGLATLTERYSGIKMPEISVVDMRDQQRRRLIKSHFSSVLLNEVTDAIKENKQAILFQNRRGFSLRIECDTCHWVPECKHCDVTLTYHKRSELLKCHYCGYSTAVPAVCPDCKSTGLKMKGFGTEKVEEELAILLPKAKIDRLDFDTTRTKNAFQRIFQKFEDRQTNVLTGTQMVT
ncbi:MAG: primosomal protein N', partial [Bacteroidales bacterium]